MKSALFWGFTHRRLVVGPDYLTLEDVTDRLSRNVGTQTDLRYVKSHKKDDLICTAGQGLNSLKEVKVITDLALHVTVVNTDIPLQSCSA